MKHILPLLLATLGVPSVAQEQPIELTLAPGKVGEVCMPLKAGQTLSWRYEASVALAFNLHTHVGRTVHMPVRRSAASDTGRYKVRRSNDWCLMWTSSATHEVTLRGAWQAHGTAK